jgi:hypothetical protein
MIIKEEKTNWKGVSNISLSKDFKSKSFCLSNFYYKIIFRNKAIKILR